jgi:hypothetical protein
MKKSHNDYFCKHQIIDALNANCDILEIDVIIIRGEVMISHSWRPFKWLTYGKAEKYFKACKDNEKILEIEIKTTDYKIINVLLKLILKYRTEDSIYILSSNNDEERKHIVDMIHACLKCSTLQVYKGMNAFREISWFELETVDLFSTNKLTDWMRM